MNLFIYDEYFKKSQKTISSIEICLNKLRLSGKTIRLENIKNLSNIIRDEIKNGVKTIVAVGNNLTLHKTINSTAEKNPDLSKIVFAFIPVGKDISFANFLGIKDEEEACHIILSRRLEKIDLPIVNNLFFFSNIKTSNKNIEINVSNEYILNPLKKGQTEVINLGQCSSKNIFIDPQDNLLNLCIKSKKKDSYLKINDIIIKNSKESLIDDCLKIKGDLKIKTSNIKINMIVGKNRYFS